MSVHTPKRHCDRPATAFACSYARLTGSLQPLGVRDVDWRRGDATDAGAVEAALDGCDAVLNAAAVYSFDAKAAREIGQTNLKATEVVLEAARRLEIDPIVHVSSLVALLPSSDPILTPDSAVGTASESFLRSPPQPDYSHLRFSL